MTKAPVTQQGGNLATADILADFGRFLRLHTADGDALPDRDISGSTAPVVWPSTLMARLTPKLPGAWK